MEAVLGKSVVEVPARLACLADLEKVATAMAVDETEFRVWLLGNL